MTSDLFDLEGFIQACTSGNVEETVKYITSSSFDIKYCLQVNEKTQTDDWLGRKNDNCAFAMALENNHFDIVKLILSSYKTNNNKEKSYFYKPSYIDIIIKKHNNLKLFDMVLKEDNWPISSSECRGIIWAIHNSDDAIKYIQCILKYYPQLINKKIDYKNEISIDHKQTFIEMAISFEKIDIIKYLMSIYDYHNIIIGKEQIDIEDSMYSARYDTIRNDQVPLIYRILMEHNLEFAYDFWSFILTFKNNKYSYLINWSPSKVFKCEQSEVENDKITKTLNEFNLIRYKGTVSNPYGSVPDAMFVGSLFSAFIYQYIWSMMHEDENDQYYDKEEIKYINNIWNNMAFLFVKHGFIFDEKINNKHLFIAYHPWIDAAFKYMHQYDTWYEKVRQYKDKHCMYTIHDIYNFSKNKIDNKSLIAYCSQPMYEEDIAKIGLGESIVRIKKFLKTCFVNGIKEQRKNILNVATEVFEENHQLIHVFKQYVLDFVCYSHTVIDLIEYLE